MKQNPPVKPRWFPVQASHRIHADRFRQFRLIKKGSLVRMWLPYPQKYRQQKDVKLIGASPTQPFIAPPVIEGDPVRARGAPAYFEQRVDDPTQPIAAKIVFDYTSYAYYPKLDDSLAQPLPANWNGASLGQRLPHWKFTPEIVAKTREVIGDETNPLAKARKIFHWVSGKHPLERRA